MSDSGNDDDGVIGYHGTTVTPAKRHPIAPAALPSTRICPSVAFMRCTRYGCAISAKFSFAYLAPASSAPMLSAIAFGFLPICLARAFSISPISTPSRCDNTPSYTMFFTSRRSFASGHTSATILSNGTG